MIVDCRLLVMLYLQDLADGEKKYGELLERGPRASGGAIVSGKEISAVFTAVARVRGIHC